MKGRIRIQTIPSVLEKAMTKNILCKFIRKSPTFNKENLHF